MINNIKDPSISLKSYYQETGERQTDEHPTFWREPHNTHHLGRVRKDYIYIKLNFKNIKFSIYLDFILQTKATKFEHTARSDTVQSKLQSNVRN